MESFFQNCVSEFDLNLFDPATAANQQTHLAVPNCAARKQCLRFLKIRWKQVSDLVKRGKETYRVLEETQKHLFEKNEECKEICNERNALFNQKSEALSEVQELKTRNKVLEEKYTQAMYQIAATQTRADQYKELTKELEKVTKNLKQVNKQCLREKIARETVEKKLTRVLADYVSPKTTKKNRWLQNLLKRYPTNKECKKHKDDLSEPDSSENETYDSVPMSPCNSDDKETENQEEQKSSVVSDNIDHVKLRVAISDEIGLSTNNSLLKRNSSLDFENIGSIDTGRGSSLAYSDGEKSFHSPEYYMNDSPLCSVTNSCSRCNVSKSDACTSTIPEDLSDGAETALNITINRCCSVSKRDACTNPQPREMFDVATDTSDISLTDRSSDICTSPDKTFDIVSSTICDSNSNLITSTITDCHDSSDEIVSPIANLNSTKATDQEYVKVQNTTTTNLLNEGKDRLDLNIIDLNINSAVYRDTETINNAKRLASPGKNLNSIQTDSEQEIASNHARISTVKLPATSAQIKENLSPDTESDICRTTPQLKEYLEPNNSNDISSIPNSNINQVLLPNSEVADIHRLQILTNKEVTTSHDVIPSPPLDKLQNNVTHDIELNVSSHTLHERECLELNNSKNLSNDIGTDNEIQTILNKMKLKYQFISPIPPTPSQASARDTMRSPKLVCNDKNTSLITAKSPMLAEGIDEHLNLIRLKIREALAPLECIPGYIQYVIKSMTSDKNNQELFSCLLRNIPNNSSNENNSHENCSQSSLCYNDKNVNVSDAILRKDSIQDTVVLTNDKDSENESEAFDKDPTADDMPQQNIELEDLEQLIEEKRDKTTETRFNTERPRKILPGITTKKKIITKLEKLKMQMLPKSKIRRELQKVRKPRFKPTPIIRVPKKKVTETDCAASLNDKSVYDKAVKVIAEAKSKNVKQEPRVIVEDCIIKMKNSPTKSPKSNDKNEMEISDKEKNKKKNVVECESVNNMLCTSVLHESMINNEIKSGKRKRTCDRKSLDEIPDCNRKIIESITNGRPIISSDRSLDSKSDTENNVGQPVETKKRRIAGCINSDNNSKTNNLIDLLSDAEDLYSSDSSVRRKKRSTIRQSLNEYSHCAKKIARKVSDSVGNNNDTALESALTIKNQSTKDNVSEPVTHSSQRILRSSLTKQNKENRPGNSTIGALSINDTEELHINTVMDQKQPEQCENKATSMPSERLIRKATLSTSQQQTPESDKNESLTTPSLEGLVQKSYTDLEMFSNKADPEHTYQKNLLCGMIEKYGIQNINFNFKKIPESATNEKCYKLEKSLEYITQLPLNQSTDAMNRLIAEIRNWDVKHFLSGFMKYLKNSDRKLELLNKFISPPAPPMTKKEQVLIYIIDELQNTYHKGIVEKILENIEYTLFALNRTPDLDVIESMSHFYALICRYYQKQSKLRLFIIDAMYCLNYKSIPLVMQCLEEWMFILPLGHMGLAKSPLVTCLVYLLHFYKCDKDKSNKVQGIRTTLQRKYCYDFSNWNETKILEIFRTSINELRDSPLEKKMLRMALIILAKRNGPKWCQFNIVIKMLQPIIEQETTSDVAKQFCILALGPLVKPYPNDMKSYSEMIAHYLLKKLEQNHSQKMQEAIITSLLYMNKHDNRINDFLLKWDPSELSSEFEDILKDYVRSKPVRLWKIILPKGNSN